MSPRPWRVLIGPGTHGTYGDRDRAIDGAKEGLSEYLTVTAAKVHGPDGEAIRVEVSGDGRGFIVTELS